MLYIFLKTKLIYFLRNIMNIGFTKYSKEYSSINSKIQQLEYTEEEKRNNKFNFKLNNSVNSFKFCPRITLF